MISDMQQGATVGILPTWLSIDTAVHTRDTPLTSEGIFFWQIELYVEFQGEKSMGKNRSRTSAKTEFTLLLETILS